MVFNVDPSLGVLKASLSVLVWVLTLLFETSEVVKWFYPWSWCWCVDDILVLNIFIFTLL